MEQESSFFFWGDKGEKEQESREYVLQHERRPNVPEQRNISLINPKSKDAFEKWNRNPAGNHCDEELA